MKENQMVEAVEVQQPERKKHFFRSLALALCLILSLSVPCFATGETSGVESVMGSFDTISTLISKVFDLVTGNWYLLLFLALSLLGLGIRGFKKAKSAAR